MEYVKMGSGGKGNVVVKPGQKELERQNVTWSLWWFIVPIVEANDSDRVSSVGFQACGNPPLTSFFLLSSASENSMFDKGDIYIFAR